MKILLLPNNSGFVISAPGIQYKIAGNSCTKSNYTAEELESFEEGFWDDGSISGSLQNAIIEEEKKVEVGEMRALLLLIIEKANS